MYNYQVTAHRATAVSHALVGNFTNTKEMSLVMSKGSRIEVHEVNSEGLVPILDVPIYGRITVMEKFRPKNEALDWIFISTERFKFCVLSIDPTRKVFVTRSHGDLSDRTGARADYGQIVFVDPEARLIGLHLYRGKLKIIPINPRNGTLQDAFNISLEELHVIDIKFLATSKPIVAVLYQDQREMRHVKTYEISIKEQEILEGPWAAPNVEVGASLIVPLPEPLGGALLLGERSICFFNGEKTKAIAIKPTIFRCYAHIAKDPTRLLLADHAGRLWLLLLQLSQDMKTLNDFKLELLGETSAASCLAYLDNKVLFLGSTLGDSQLIRLTPDRDETSGDFLQLLENYTNTGPLVDMTTVEMDRLLANHPASSTNSNAATTTLPSASQTQIIACSGAFKDGSLRVIRNGIGISEHAQLDLEGMLRVFSLNFGDSLANNPASAAGRASGGSKRRSTSMEVDQPFSLQELPADKLLFISYVSETRLLKISGEELEEIRLDGVSHSETTLLASNIPDTSFIVQVTPKAVYIVDADKKALVDTWKPSGAHSSLNVAAIAGSTLVVGVGSSVHLLSIDAQGKVQETLKKQMAHEVACVAIEIESNECFCAVGQWQDNSVSILHIVDGGKDAREVHKELLGGEILPRSVIFANFDSSRHLVIGMGDGHVYSFVFDPAKAMHASQTGEVKDAAASEEEKVLRQKKKMALGRQPVTLIPFFNRGALNVLACGDRPTVVYSKNGKIVFSPVNLPHVTGLCELNTKEFPDALAFATKEALRIGTVDEIQKLHIRTIPLGEMARRVAHHKPSRTFVVSTARYETHEATGEETEVCAIKLLDDTGFELLDSFKLDLHECAESLTPVLFTGDSRTYCAVGTGYLIPTELEPTKGRLLIFEIETTLTSSQSVTGGALSVATGPSSSGSSASMVVSGRLKLVHELEVPGMVWCMTAFAGKLLCGVSFSVQLYAWNETRDGSRELKMECEHTNHVQALCLATRDNHIYVGDLMRGTSVLEYKPVDGRIEQLAMDLRPNCIMAVAILDGHHYLAAENSLNLMTVKLNTDAGATNDEREFLSPVGSFHLGDQPNAFRSGSLVMQLPDQDSLTLPSILYATVSGAIGVIASLPKELYDELLALQNAILKIVKGIGNFDHSEWRAYNDARKTSPHSNFIDGDLIESVLDFSPEEQNRIAKAVGIPVEEMIKKIEAVSQATH